MLATTRLRRIYQLRNPRAPIAQANNVYTPGATELIIDAAGDKAALGSGTGHDDADGPGGLALSRRLKRK